MLMCNSIFNSIILSFHAHTRFDFFFPSLGEPFEPNVFDLKNVINLALKINPFPKGLTKTIFFTRTHDLSQLQPVLDLHLTWTPPDTPPFESFAE